ncbi:disease resistance RPP13-like protein 4 [Dioscorea cayenensis subsp. rotundata]|uniref:Disease resistance RPP13-like protein 4 n=1 Tax=Dioscorea cayennensis subsp. rotundata TaxID=55577 RepID=A0AB40CPH7_DIOCR|nr:disease resistance RPP13-like protein 4 [Dioscorea cayenensis subsp. rotundata]
MAMIVDAFAGKLVERLTNVIEEKAIMVLGVKDELQRLRRRMKRLALVLKDAERRRIQDEAVKGWVDELKDVMYDAEDIIDLCMIQGMGLLQDDHHSPAESSSSTASKRVRCYNFPLLSCVRSVPFRYEISDKIKNLNVKLEEISEDKDKFNFINSSSNSGDAYVVNQPSSHQSSSLPEPDIVGWDIRDATNSLVELLVSPHEQKCRLFAIVDVWIELIKSLIQIATTKCRVLVTTRDRNIAMKMRAVHIHNASKLSSDFGWELLCKNVFTNNEVSDMQRMKDIGMQIIEKCDGLPISSKAIAGVLLTKDRNKREWENVLHNDAWTITGLPKELRGALYLSYKDLPSALKQCFLYCSLKPKNCEFDYYELVPEWIAEGYIKASGNSSMEDVAKDYYMELIKRSFLQPNPDYVDMSTCTVHDLLRGLAQALAGDENFIGDPQDAQKTDSIKIGTSSDSVK